MEKNQNVRKLTINPTADYNAYIEAIKASGIEANWHEKMFLRKPQHLEAMNYALELSKNEVKHYFKHGLGDSPLAQAILDPNFKDFSKANQQSIIDYVQASLANAKYQYYPEAYGPCPSTPTFKLDIPFASDEDSSILVILDPYMGKHNSTTISDSPVSSADDLYLNL